MTPRDADISGLRRGAPVWSRRAFLGRLLPAGMMALAGLGGCGKAVGRDGPIELNVLMGPDVSGVRRGLIGQFNAANPGIRVNFIEGPSATNSMEDLYATAFLSGDATYDLVYADVVWVPKFAAAGWLEDLTDRLSPSEREQFIPGSVAGSTFNGRMYRVPAMMDGGLLYYRADLLGAAGERPPRTFDDLTRIARRLQKPDQLWGYVWQGKQYEGLMCDFVEVLGGYGGTWVDARTGAVGLDRPQAVDALGFLKGCIDVQRISPPGTTTYAEEDSRQIFQAGRAVFHRNWPYAWGLAQKEGSAIRGKVGMVPMPATDGLRRAQSSRGKPTSTLGGWGYCLARGGRNKDAAWKFVRWISALPQVERVYAATGELPALKAFYEGSADPFRRDVYEVLRATVPRPPIPQYAQASDILQRHVSAALSGRTTPEEALRAAARETRLLLGRR